jgi:hypothetical protein
MGKDITELTNISSPSGAAGVYVHEPGSDPNRRMPWTDVLAENLAEAESNIGGAGRTVTVKDNEDALTALTARVAVLEQIVVPIGGTIEYAGAVAPTGFLIEDGTTIGDTGSGADHEGPEFEALFDICNVAGRWGNPGSAVFATGGTVKIPDTRNVPVFGANASTRAVNGVTQDASPLGVEHSDKLQGHYHTLEGTNAAFGGGVGDAPFGGQPSDVVLVDNAGISFVHEPITDGPSGTPRTGTTTRTAGIGKTKIIRYM